MQDLTELRGMIQRLKRRLVDGELDAMAFQQQLELLMVGLSPAERESVLGTHTPVGTPIPGTPLPQPAGMPGSVAGPSGGAGSGVRTERPRLADLRLEPGIVLFDQWRIVRELGRGGFGAVFEAEEIQLEKIHALKVLDPEMVAREELLEHFRREVNLMRDLVHPRIVRVYDYREDRGEHLALISMEYVAGCAVRDLLALARSRKVPVPVELTLAILEQVLESLAVAHAQGVIHRDVTPGNILLAGGTAEELLASWGDEPASRRGGKVTTGIDPQVKLVDFGIAGLVERTELSQKSRMMGTAGYVAPEALDADAEVTAAADVFGAGAVAYELLCGKVPLATGFRDIAQLDSRLVEGFSRVVMHLVAAAPSERPASRAALDLLLREAPLQLVTDRRGQPVELECPLDGKRNRPEETFRCRGCGQGDLCLTHLDPKERICVECVARRRPEQEKREAVAAIKLLKALRQGEVRSLLSGMEFVQIPAGSFLMGSNHGIDNMPVHRVTISRPFELQTTPVTQGQWRAVMRNNPHPFKKRYDYDPLYPEKFDDYPVGRVSWNDVQVFLEKLNALDPGKNFRLPTEAEWEYACRAGTTGERYGELDAIAWYRGNSGGQTHPVGQKQPNAWGLYDMLGNVWEWCADWYGENYYAISPATDPRGPSSGSYRVLRGCFWDSVGDFTLCTERDKQQPGSGYGDEWSFRCARG